MYILRQRARLRQPCRLFSQWLPNSYIRKARGFKYVQDGSTHDARAAHPRGDMRTRSKAHRSYQSELYSEDHLRDRMPPVPTERSVERDPMFA